MLGFNNASENEIKKRQAIASRNNSPPERGTITTAAFSSNTPVVDNNARHIPSAHPTVILITGARFGRVPTLPNCRRGLTFLAWIGPSVTCVRSSYSTRSPPGGMMSCCRSTLSTADAHITRVSPAREDSGRRPGIAKRCRRMFSFGFEPQRRHTPRAPFRRRQPVRSAAQSGRRHRHLGLGADRLARPQREKKMRQVAQAHLDNLERLEAELPRRCFAFATALAGRNLAAGRVRYAAGVLRRRRTSSASTRASISD
jgi:hypothetical protein